MSEPASGASADSRGSPGRGLLLTLIALVTGIAVLAGMGRSVPSTTVAAASPPTSTTATTTAPTTTTTSLPTHAPSAVKVLVANGTTVPGLAGHFSSQLSAKGYDTLSPTDTTSPAKVSDVYYQEGYQGDAEAVAGMLGLPASATLALSSSVPVASSSADLVVVVGPDLASAAGGGSSGATGSTTTTG